MAQNNGAPIVVAALIIGSAIVAAGLLVRSSVERTAGEITALKDSLGDLANAGSPSPSPSRAARPGRPDPNRRYAVKTDGAPTKGGPNAEVAIVEFSDFQCPFCSRVTPTLQQIQREYGDQVQIVFKHLPLRIHPKAPAAHAAAEAAHRQGKFWEMHDLIFANQREMSPEKYEEYAQQLELDMDQFRADVASESVKSRVDADAAEASSLGVTGTPGFFVNGRFVSGAQPYSTFKSMIDAELGQG